MEIISDFWRFIRVRRKYWLGPAMVVSITIGGLLVLTQGTAVAPFIYTIF